MPKVNFVKVQIRSSELNSHVVIVPPWEVSILEAMYGDDAKVVGEEVVDRKLPEAADEFARLAQRYGPRNEDTPFVAAVYGNFGPGVNALAKEIEASAKTPDEAETTVRTFEDLSDDELTALT